MTDATGIDDIDPNLQPYSDGGPANVPSSVIEVIDHVIHQYSVKSPDQTSVPTNTLAPVASGACEMMLAKSYDTISPPSFAISDTIQIKNVEQSRSITNKDVICRCGFKSDKTGALTGQKRRTRCKKCAGCMALKCGKCRPCNVPSMKKPCENRACQFPIIPKCPCFQ